MAEDTGDSGSVVDRTVGHTASAPRVVNATAPRSDAEAAPRSVEPTGLAGSRETRRKKQASKGKAHTRNRFMSVYTHLDITLTG